MLRKIISIILICLLPVLAHSADATTTPIKRVIYITLDGVRWQDVFLDTSLLPIFWEKHAKDAAIYGAPNSLTTMEVASIPVSLPSYQSQMSGRVSACGNNRCGRIPLATFPEALVKKLHFSKKEVASISSWEMTDFALESVADTTFSNHGTRPMSDPDTTLVDGIMDEINQQQSMAYPGDDTRLDQYTFLQSLHYLEKYKPRFLWISFADADEVAHLGDLAGYHRSIKFYDECIDQVITLLKNLNLYQETMIIITTDHGRGNGKNWTEHGEDYPESKQTWAFVLNGKLIPDSHTGNVYHYSTLSIRPTVEKAFGIA